MERNERNITEDWQSELERKNKVEEITFWITSATLLSASLIYKFRDNLLPVIWETAVTLAKVGALFLVVLAIKSVIKFFVNKIVK